MLKTPLRWVFNDQTAREAFLKTLARILHADQNVEFRLKHPLILNSIVNVWCKINLLYFFLRF